MVQEQISAALFLIVLSVAAWAQEEPGASVVRLDINKDWRFREATGESWYPASVPGSVHTDLMRSNLIPDPFFGTNEREIQWVGEKDWIYETTFDLPREVLWKETVELVFKGLDTYATVRLNDTLLLVADNMFREWRRECKSLLKEKGNVLAIRFANVFDATLPKHKSAPFALQAFDNNDQAEVKIAMYSRKAQFHFGWDWGPRLITCGVWRPVYVEAWNVLRVQSVHVQEENVSAAGADITSVFEIRSSRRQRAVLSVTMDGLTLASEEQELREGLNMVTVKGRIARPILWWTNGLGSQYLYSYRATVADRDGNTDEYATKIGVRSLEMVREKDSFGTSLFVRLNGVPVFMKGANHIPQDNFQNRVTPERYEHLIRSAAQAHMNMLRVWGGGIYEEDLFYELCDRYGILLWHDMMFACAMYPADETFLENVRHEIIDNIKRIRNHPSLALYCGNNENHAAWYGWGWKKLYPPPVQEVCERNLRKLFDDVIPAALAEADPTRYYQPSSPMAGFDDISPMEGDIHYWGVWHGKEPFESYGKNIARFVSEYGFQSYPQQSSVIRFTEPKDRELHSPVMLSHQRCMADERRDKEYGNRLIAAYMEKLMRQPKDFASYLYVSQILQAEGVKMAIEAHRRNMPTCMGSLFWQIDDCWPVASWSSIDYYGEWKALHYYAKKLYEPVIIAPQLENDSVRLYIVSDKVESTPCELQVRVLNFEGREIYARNFRVSVKANTSDVYIQLRKLDLTGGEEEGNLVMTSRLVSDDITIAENLTYFSHPKDLHLPSPNIKVEVTKREDSFEIQLSSNTLAKNVYLSCETREGFFTDNYFDLLPQVPKQIDFRPRRNSSDIQTTFKVISLVDSY